MFRREGYHRASLDRIAAEAGFTTGAVYSTFDSKADVMLALLAARVELRRALWTEVLDSTSTVEDFVTEVARRFAREVAAEHDWLAVSSEFMIVIGRDKELQPRYAALHEAGLAALTASIRTWLRRTASDRLSSRGDWRRLWPHSTADWCWRGWSRRPRCRRS